jgi:phenylalanyl-tRNA synthetase beta chain
MKISLEWIREHVAVDLPLPELLERLTMIGLVADSVEERDGDVVLDLETYANRPDTLGHLGVAREIAAMLGVPLLDRPWPLVELDQPVAEITSVEVRDEALCPRYCGMVVRGVTVGPSPDWLRRRVEAMGLRPINNVVDVTNYVLYDTAQPIHAFDFAKLAGSRIVVRRAGRGEKLRDLEGRTLELSPEMLVIADEADPVALAGVIGGERSGVRAATRDVFIESAHFDPVSIRLTSKKLGLSTDAAYRYERGTDVTFLPQAARMVASLLTGMSGRAAKGVIDVYPKPRKAKSVVLRERRVSELLGIEVPRGFIRELLPRLGFELEAAQEGVWKAGVPAFRVDVDREADLVEEVARFYGYDRIPAEVTPARSFDLPTNETRGRVGKARRILLGRGFDEVINMSFADPEKEKVVGSGRAPIGLRNPLSAKASLLRTNMIVGLLENAAWNLNRGMEGVHVFEIGNVYFWKGDRAEEQLTLGLLSTGLLEPPGWQEQEKDAGTDFYVLKGALESLLAGLRYEAYSFEAADHPYFEEGRALALLYKGEAVGRAGVLRKDVVAITPVHDPVFAAEVDLAGLFAKQPSPFEYVPVPKFPGVSRDLSFLVDARLPYAEIGRVLDKMTLPHLEGYELRDRFAGPSVPGGKVSLTLRFRYRHPQRTLLAEEVDRMEKEIVGRLESACHIQLREGKN